MNRFVITPILIIVAVFDPISSSMGAEGQSSQPDARSKLMIQLVNSLQKASPEPNSVTDPNVKGTKDEEYKELDRALRRVDRLSRDEVQEWTKNTGDNRLDLAKAVNKQVEDELKYLRKLSKEEGCGKTSEAIKRLLVLREKRFTQFIKEMENTSTRRGGRTGRTSREQGLDPVRGRGSRDSDLQGMSSEERRRAWEERRRAERERRLQERNAQRNRSQQDNSSDYSGPNP
jgi:hypothetical protein